MSAHKLDGARIRVALHEGQSDSSQRLETLTALLEDGHSVSCTRTAPDPADDLVVARFDESVDTIRARVEDKIGQSGQEAPAYWKPWFPVIDYDRCTNCMQCLTFCLFDVYSVKDEKIDVQNESNCKTDCPACSRVCPEAAIIFPKYKKGPINGDVVRAEDLQNEAMKVDISTLLGGDLYAALRTRSDEARKRFSTERDESKALLERKRCLKKLKKQLDIPDEVLMTLPSAGDIEDRTRRALEKAKRRDERSQSVKDKKPTTEDDWEI